MARLRQSIGEKIILGIDRLNYIIGVPQELYALNKMLTENSKWIGKVVMVQLCSAIRSRVTEHKLLCEQVETFVGHISGKHGIVGPLLIVFPL